MGLLDGKVAIITGSGRGIGKGIALRFVEEGCAVAINDIDADVCAATVKEITDAGGKAIACKSWKWTWKKKRQGITDAGGKAIACKADVTSWEEVKKMVDDTVEAFGTVDILVNNAGITKDAMVHKMSDQLWNFILNVNLKGTFLCTKAVAPIMKEKKYGKIINTASTTGLMGNVGQANYAAAKGGVIAFTKACAREMALDRVAVNCYGPGFIATRLTAVKEAAGGDRSSLGIPKGVRDAAISAIPFGRAGEPEDVANVALFFASPMSDFVTGQVINISGGMLI